MTLRRVFIPLFVLALVLLAVPPAVSGSPIARQGATDDESRGTDAEVQEASPESEPQTSRFDDPQYADQQILDDLIVDGSACVGLDCVNGESFGFDTIRLKENNLRIRAFDTSSTASFPTTDWEIMFNESSNGGANVFAINDIDSGRRPFSIEASAPSNSLYVDDGGRIGFGTKTPVTTLHAVNGNTPTLRLEQNGTSGFTPQTWDLAGNETNFFIRDATNGSTLPFRIRPSAPTSAIDVAGTTGNVGLGASSPSEELHIRDTDNPRIRLEDTDNANQNWTIGHSNDGDLIFIDDGGVQFRFYPDGRVRTTPVDVAPSTGVSNGDFYVDSDGDGTFCFRSGGVWIAVAGGGTCA